MITVVNMIVFFLQIGLLIRSVYYFKKNPLDFSAIFYFLYILFYALAHWDYLIGLNLFSNAFLEYFELTPSISSVTYYGLMSILIMVCFEAGYSFKRHTKGIIYPEFHIKEFNYKILQLTLMITWAFLTFRAFVGYGGSLELFFSPARKTIYTSGYEISMVVIIPTTLLTMSIIRGIENRKKYIFQNIIFCIILILTQMSLGQRREIVNGVVYISLLMLMASIYTHGNYFSRLITKKIRRTLTRLATLVAFLVPSLWWWRTYSTQVQRGVEEIVMPWQIRGWFELLFGSSTTGFQTTLILDNFIETFRPFWLHSVFFMSSIIIPRSIMPSKPMSITKTMQFIFGVEGNLSLFYINDMYFNFGVFSFFVSFLFGYAFSNFYNSRLRSVHFVPKVFSVLLLAQIILLFKNGFAQYTIMIVQYFLVFYLSLQFIIKRHKITSDLTEVTMNNE